MSGGSNANVWNVFFGTPPDADDQDRSFLNRVLDQRRSRIKTPGVPYMVDPFGRADPIINSYFYVAMRRGINTGGGHGTYRLRPNSARSYAYDIRVFLNTLHALGRRWHDLDSSDIDDIREWRLYGEGNSQRITDATWERQSHAISSLYSYAEGFGVPNPLSQSLAGGGTHGGGYVRNADVKWFEPKAYAQWRDIGLGGLLPNGDENLSFRGRNVQRDMAFANALYRTGLRVQECGSVLRGLEWPDDIRTDGSYQRSQLAGSCAKGGRERPYWIPAVVTAETKAYGLGERAAAVSRGQEAYSKQDDRLIISSHTPSGLLTLIDKNGATKSTKRRIGDLTLSERKRLYVDRGGFLDPALLWLNQDGQPRDHRSWNRTFARANDRVKTLGLTMAPMKPHYLRHSFALRWFVVARLLWDRRLTLMSESEAEDLRHEMGSHWILVQTLLGHRHPNTTMRVYLEPFQGLDIELLSEHATDDSVSGLMANLFRENNRVQGEVRV